MHSLLRISDEDVTTYVRCMTSFRIRSVHWLLGPIILVVISIMLVSNEDCHGKALFSSFPSQLVGNYFEQVLRRFLQYDVVCASYYVE